MHGLRYLTICLLLLPVLAVWEDGPGKEIYDSSGCIVCHGSDGKGGVIPGVPDFTSKKGPLAQKPDQLLLKHMLEGFQSPDSPMAMPAKGGNVGLTEGDLRDVLEYLRKEFGP